MGVAPSPWMATHSEAMSSTGRVPIAGSVLADSVVDSGAARVLAGTVSSVPVVPTVVMVATVSGGDAAVSSAESDERPPRTATVTATTTIAIAKAATKRLAWRDAITGRS